jgi:hypothetical protein
MDFKQFGDNRRVIVRHRFDSGADDDECQGNAKTADLALRLLTPIAENGNDSSDAENDSKN